jgi:hypothetical protein
VLPFLAKINKVDFDASKPISIPLISGSGQSGRWSVGYNRYLRLHGDANENISWNFETIPNSVEIILLIMDDYSYTSFESDLGNTNLSTTVYSWSFIADIQSENKVKDSGIFLIPYWSDWYVIFVNLDSNHQSCQVKYNIEYDCCDSSWFYVNDDYETPVYQIIFVVSLFGVTVFIIAILRYKINNY